MKKNKQQRPASGRGRPLVSVVIPVFNGSKYLKEAVRSVMASTFGDFEVLLIDDGSKDASKELCHQLEKQYAQVRFYSFPENRGLGRVLNFALRKAQGKYIARINQDDRMHKTRLAQQVAFMEANSELVLLGSWLVVEDEDGQQRINRYLETDVEIKKSWLKLSPVWDAAVIYRKDVAIRVGGYDQAFWPADDLHMWYRLGKVGKIANLQEPLTTIKQHGGAVSVSHHRIHMRKIYEVHRFAHAQIEQASLTMQIYWLAMLGAGYIFPAWFNWWVYRVMKRLVFREFSKASDPQKRISRTLEKLILSCMPKKVSKERHALSGQSGLALGSFIRKSTS